MKGAYYNEIDPYAAQWLRNLIAAGQLAAPWWDILGLPQSATLPDVERRWRELAGAHHPDKGGDAARFVAVTEAVRQARDALKE